MTLLRVKTANGIIPIEFGLNSGTEQILENGIKQSYVAAAMEHIITVLETKKSKYGLGQVKFMGMFPEIANDLGKETSADLEIPIVVVLIRLGGQKEVGIGRTVSPTEDGDAKGFNQSATIEFDCYGNDQNVADRIAGSVSLLLQQELFTFMRKGFQNLKTVFSRPAKGWNPNIAWDFETMWYPFRVMRHVINTLTSFDVIWVETPTSEGTITQILWKTTGETILEFSQGNSLAYMLVEDMEFGLHGVFI